MTKGTKNSSDEMKIGQTLRDVLLQAKADRRITCGLYESGLILEMNPDGVMLCILPLNQTDDIALDIHYTLIEAFCLENGISLLKVDSEPKLRSLLDERPVAASDETKTEGDDTDLTNFNCVLVEYSSSECTELEGDVLEYFKATCDMVPEPVVELAI